MDSLVTKLKSIVGSDGVLSGRDELLVYECDGLAQHKFLPRAVVFPRSTEQVSAVVSALAEANVPIVPRGAGTGLSGGAVALDAGVIIELARMKRVLEIDPANRTIRVETGFINAQVTTAATPYGFYYAPDPSSQAACTIGGNLAENAGGIHCLKYGTTVDHVLSVRLVLPDGQMTEFGAPETGAVGFDLLGVFIGSEGTFGIATEATLRLTPFPQTVRTLLADFIDVDDASRAVSGIIANGLIPAALEMMDGAVIRAVEDSVFAAGMPRDAGAALLIELDGIAAGVALDAERARAICIANGARTVKVAEDDAARKKLWAARKGAFGAMGRIAPDMMLQDAVVPRSKLPEVLAEVNRIGVKYNLKIANVFHAGDGNLHPLICYDSRIEGEVDRVKEAGRELVQTSVRAGGSITGEHGVGLDKRDYLPLIFSGDDMDAMLAVRSAFDPAGLLNPGKIIPTPPGCGEGRRVAKELLAKITADGAPPVVKRSSFRHSSSSSKTEARERNDHDAHFEQVTARAQLERVFGTDRVRVDRGLVVEPEDHEQVRDLLRLAQENNWPVVPAGVGAWLDTGYTNTASGVVVSTARMNRVVEYEPADLVVTVEAGQPFDELNRFLLDSARQWLPLDPPHDTNATIGGIVATAKSGPQSIGFGTVRNAVLGMKVMLADGRVIKTGGKVVKNVAGYDLGKLFTGSLGTLGIILETTFKLKPAPERDTTLIAFGDVRELAIAGRSIYETDAGACAIELVSREMMRRLDPAMESGFPALLIRFAGNEKSVESQVLKANQNLGSINGVRHIESLNSGVAPWEFLARISAANTITTSSLITVRPDRIPSFVETLGPNEIWHAGAGDGRIRFLETANDTDGNRLRELREAARANGGGLIIESASLEIKQAVGVWGDLSNETLMRRIKNAIDPLGLMSPGRFWKQ